LNAVRLDLDGLDGLPGQGARSDAVVSNDPDHVPMDGNWRMGGVANLQIEIEVDEIIEFEVGIVVLAAGLTHYRDLDAVFDGGA
jgi:hypothetical protein